MPIYFTMTLRYNYLQELFMKNMIAWFKNIFLGESSSEFYYQHEEARYEFDSENHKLNFLTSNKAS